MKRVLSGNEAIARGAYEAGVSFATGYPGTPSTEILENLIRFDRITVEWSPNEKVALEVGSGASLGGARTLVTMKHVGLNVAADPLLTLPYIGVRGGLVLVTADDPDMHSSQNEQDNRAYASFAKVPLLEPSDSQEAKDLVKTAFDLSEKFDTLVMLRTTTRIAHSDSVVSLGQVRRPKVSLRISKDVAKYVMVPAFARRRHPLIEKRMGNLAALAEISSLNRIEWGSKDVGMITSGISYQYVKEVYPNFSVLKLGMTHPLPDRMISQFAARVKKLYVVEELEPYLEDHIRSLGVVVHGKSRLPRCGELNPDIVEQGLSAKKVKLRKTDVAVSSVPARPPNLCAGCPHRGVFYSLNRLNVFVTGDIGCYTLAHMPPLNSLDTALCMGAGIGQAHGIERALGPDAQGKVVAVIGDSTFLHSGITGLMNMAYNRGKGTVVLLDNRFTAMTGGQEHPGTGFTMAGEPTFRVDYMHLGEALGVRHIRTINPYNLQKTYSVLKEEASRPELSLVISEAPCILNRREYTPFTDRFEIDQEQCIGCGTCIRLGCPALGWNAEAASRATGDGTATR
ncbi:MAG TPA: indolepyruvate ferredoxin oxidoreductase subunit alpha, partial [Thermodesulfobacteriota bacterium]|nr:indolepyruvate ferredoxin oxidoreductase subunit alpha [Thermodesulfobacteriota bacterium]